MGEVAMVRLNFTMAPWSYVASHGSDGLSSLGIGAIAYTAREIVLHHASLPSWLGSGRWAPAGACLSDGDEL